MKQLFENQMSRSQTVLGWIYLPVHIFVLPLLLSLYAEFSPSPMTEAQVNFAYYVISVVVLLVIMLRFLRSGFDVLLDRPLLSLLAVLRAWLMMYALGLAAALILTLLFPEEATNPNNETIMELVNIDSGMMKAAGIFLAPVVEELLFRGVVFGSIRTRSRGWAYAVSALLFSLIHVWQYALAYQDARELLFILQYIPASVALAYAYERSGSIWTSIFFHMGINAVSIQTLELLKQL